MTPSRQASVCTSGRTCEQSPHVLDLGVASGAEAHVLTMGIASDAQAMPRAEDVEPGRA